MKTAWAHWCVTVLRRGVGPAVVRIAVRGREVELRPQGSTRPLVLDIRQLAELIEDLRAAGRLLRAHDAADYVREVGREQRGPALFEPILSDAERDTLDDDGGKPIDDV